MCADETISTRALNMHFVHRTYVFKSHLGPNDVEAFVATWSRLQPDQYLEKPLSRSRRVTKFLFSRRERLLTPLQDTSFFQSSTVNSLLGGISRVYKRSEPGFIDSPVLRDILEQDAEHVCENDHTEKWLVTCHQFRIHCRAGEAGQPTPEGLHCDGHSYVFQHFIQKSAVVGGESRVCTRSGETIARITLSTFLETVFLDDRELLHEVSPITLTSRSGPEGYRDMLIVDFDPVETSQ